MMLARTSSSFLKPSKLASKRLNAIRTLSLTTNEFNFKYDAPWLHYYSDHKHPDVMNFINGSFHHPDDAGMKFSCNIECKDPSTNNVLSYVPESASKRDDVANTPSALDQAIAAAKEAYPSWSSTPVQTRQRLLLDYAHLLHKMEVREEIAYWISLEQGKTTADAMGDVWRGLEVVEAATRVGVDMMGDSLQNLSTGLDTISYRQPLGVCAGIAPFNFPAMIPLWMFPLALATGNTYVLKPTEKAPSASLLLASYLHELGLPRGVLNVVNGSHQTVNRIISHPDIKAVSFVGSNKAGEYIHDVGSRNGKRVQANLGAKNHATILMDDADKSSTIKAIVGAAFGAAGQRCMALSVVILVGDVNESQKWIDDIVQEAKKLVVGNGFQEGVDVGPLISNEALQRAEQIIQSSLSEGATCKLDGRGVIVDEFEGGNWLGPTIIDLHDVNSNQPITNPAYTEEIFAPVLTILTAPTLDDAIKITNNNTYGNGCALFTSSGAAARKYQFEVEAGQVGIK